MSHPAMSFASAQTELAGCAKALSLLTEKDTRTAFQIALPEGLYRQVVAAVIDRQVQVLPNIQE